MPTLPESVLWLNSKTSSDLGLQSSLTPRTKAFSFLPPSRSDCIRSSRQNIAPSRSDCIKLFRKSGAACDMAWYNIWVFKFWPVIFQLKTLEIVVYAFNLAFLKVISHTFWLILYLRLVLNLIFHLGLIRNNGQRIKVHFWCHRELLLTLNLISGPIAIRSLRRLIDWDMDGWTIFWI